MEDGEITAEEEAILARAIVTNEESLLVDLPPAELSSTTSTTRRERQSCS